MLLTSYILNVNFFICILDKSKRKLKKRKTVETNDNYREFEPTHDLHKKQNTIEVDNCVSGNNALNVAEIDRNILNHFVDEENAFNEWLQSCEQMDSIIMNEPFLKLLNLFTSCTIESDDKPVMCKTDGEPNIRWAGESGFDDLFRSQGIHGNCITNNINMIDNEIISTAPKHVTNNKRAYREYGKNTDFEVLSKSPKLNSCIYDGSKEEIVVNHLNNFNLSIQSNGRQNSTEICSGKYKTENIEPKEDGRARKIDFDELFKNQVINRSPEDKNQVYTDSEDLFKSPKPKRNVVGRKEETVVEKLNSIEPVGGRISQVACIESFKVNNFEPKKDRRTRKIDFDELFRSQTSGMSVKNNEDSCKQQLKAIDREVTKKLKHEVVDIGRIGDCDDDVTVETMIPVECDEDDEDDIFLGNVEFENLFRSQRAETYIENYNDKIVSELSDDGSDHSIEPIDIKRKSPMVCKEIFSQGSTKRVGKMDSDELFRSRKAGVEKILKDATIDLVHDEDDNDGHTGMVKLDTDRKDNRRIGSINYECLFDVQPTNRYIEDYMVRSGLPPRKKVVPVMDGDDDDVVSLNSSPEFFSLKLPKKTIQKKLNECVQAPVENNEIVDLSTPPPRVPDLTVDQLKVNDRFPLTGAACDSLSYKHDGENQATTNIFGGGFDDNDDDDMDFMFDDYCGTSADVVEDSDNDVFTQKQQPVEDSGNDVFTQRLPVEDSGNVVLTQKQLINKSGTDIFTQKPRVDKRDTSDLPQKHWGDPRGTEFFTQQQWFHKRDTDALLQKQRFDKSGTTAVAQKQWADDDKIAATRRPLSAKEAAQLSQRRLEHEPTAAPAVDNTTATKTVLSTTSKPSVFNDRSGSSKVAFPQPSNILKAYNLLKPGFSLKRNTATTSKRQQNVVGDKPVALNRQQQFGENSVTFDRKHRTDDGRGALKRLQVGDRSETFDQQQRADNKPSAVVSYSVNRRPVADDVSPVPGHLRWKSRFSQSTPKAVKGTTVLEKQQQQQPTVPTVAHKTVNLLLTSSSSDSDAIFDVKSTSLNRVKKKRRRKPKKVSFISYACIFHIYCPVLTS